MWTRTARLLSFGSSISSLRTIRFNRRFCGTPTVPASEPAQCVEVVLSSLRQTQELAQRVAASSSTGDAILLFGEFGSGKSEWARAFIRARTGVADLEVPSPSFILSIRYPFPDAVEGGFIHHMDLYRLSTAQQAEFLGIDEAIRKGICLIEWPQCLSHCTPVNRLEIRFDDAVELGDESRRVTLSAFGSLWTSRVNRFTQLPLV